MQFEHVIGVDISKSKFDIAFSADQNCEHREFNNDNKGISSLIKFMLAAGASPQNTLVCMEHTGHYIDRITRILHGEGYFVWVVPPLVLRYFSPDLNRLKDDKTDAKKLLSYARSFQDLAEPYIPENGPQTKLRNLERLRRQLVRMGTTIQNMMASNNDLASPCMISQSILGNLLAHLKQCEKDVDKELKELVLSTPRFRKLYQILITVPGIGPVVARQMILYTRGFTRFKSHKAFACYISTAPFEKSSGNKKRSPRVSKIGHKKVKTILFMGALRHIQPKGFFESVYLYATQIDKKHHNSVMNALINEMIKIAFHLVKTEQLFDKEKYLNNKQNKTKYLILS